jgi:DNA polymerase-3 subunit epsilon
MRDKNMTQQTSFYHRAFLSVDTETTGKDSSTARIVSVSMVVDYPSADAKPAIKEWLINPGVEIPQEAIDVHGITNEMVKENGLDPKVALQEVANALMKWETQGLPMVIFNSQYDATLFLNEFKRHNIIFRGDFRRVVDPYVLDKHFSYRKGKRTLEAMAEFYGVPFVDAHNSTADSIAAAKVLRVLGEKYEINHSPEELFDFQVAAKKKQSLSLQAYFRKNDPETIIHTGWPYRTAESDAEDIKRSPVQPALV